MTSAQNPEPESQTTDTFGGPDPSSSREDELADPNAGAPGPDTFGGPDRGEEDELRPEP